MSWKRDRRSGKWFKTRNVTIVTRTLPFSGEKCSLYFCCVNVFFLLLMAAVWQHPDRASLKRYSSLLSAQAGHSVLPVSTDTHKGVKVQLPWCAVIQWELKNTWAGKKNKKKNTHCESHEIKTLQTVRYNWERKILNAIDHFWSWKKLFPTKKSQLHRLWLMAMFCVSFLILSLKSSTKKTKQKKEGVLPPPQSHTLSIFFAEVRAGPEINTFITDNRHFDKKRTLSISVCTNFVWGPASQRFVLLLHTEHRQLKKKKSFRTS